MSEENVEAVRKTVEYWNRGDLEAFLDIVDEDQVIRTAEGWPERVVNGKDAVRSFYEAIAKTVGREGMIEDLIDAGDRIVLRIRQRYSGEQSGVEGDLEFSQVLTFRKGKIVMAEYFWDHQEALEAVGLSE